MRTRHLLGVVVTAVLVGGGCSNVRDIASDQPTATATGSTATTSPSPSAATPTAPEATTAEPTQSTPPPPPDRPAPVVRECRRLATNEALLGVVLQQSRAVPCRKGHNAQTYFVGRLTADARDAVRNGNRGQLYLLASSRCRRNLVDWLGGDGGDLALSQFAFVVGVPSVDDLTAGARWLRCDAVAQRTQTSFLRLPRTTQGVLVSARAGQFDICVKGDIEKANTVVCSLPHRWRGASAVRLGSAGAAFPGGNVVTSRMRSTCETRVRSYLGTTSAFSYGWIRPTKATWQRGSRYGVCYAQLTS